MRTRLSFIPFFMKPFEYLLLNRKNKFEALSMKIRGTSLYGPIYIYVFFVTYHSFITYAIFTIPYRADLKIAHRVSMTQCGM